MWPRTWHDEVFRRDYVRELIGGAVYTSEIDWTKPHPEACLFVGDRPYDDVHGAKSVGMRAVLVPHSDVPPYEAAEPDAVISRLAELQPLLASW